VPRLARWALVLVYVSAIYLTIPYIPGCWSGLQRLTGASFHSLSLLVLAAAGAATIAGGLSLGRLRPAALVWLAVLAGAYAYLFARVLQEPIERLHLVQYGLLSWAIWWAWPQGGTPIVWRALPVWLLNAAVGAADEWIQHVTPGRFGEFRDVLINWESAALGLGVLLVFVAPRRGEPGASGVP
jgi:VanZ family protein